MKENRNLRLCGGTFFTILLEINKTCNSTQDDRFRDFLGIIDPKVLELVPAGEAKDYLHTYASNFKNCKNVPNSGRYIHLGNSGVCATFRDEIKVDSSKVLDRVQAFDKNYIHKDSHRLLIRVLLELIEADAGIDDNIELYVLPGFKPIKKQELLQENIKISYFDFLLGIWFYIYENCGDNTIGETTIQFWREEKESNGNISIFNTSPKYQDIDISDDIEKETNKHNLSDNEENKMSSNPKTDDEDVDYSVEDDGHELTILDFQKASESYEATMQLSNLLLQRSRKELREYGKKLEEQEKKLKIDHDNNKNYLKRLDADYNKARTILHHDDKQPFYDFYVNSDLEEVISSYKSKKDAEQIYAPTAKTFYDKTDTHLTNFTLIYGLGGQGKSMFLNHILLSAIELYEEYEILPVFICLRDYEGETKTFEEFVLHIIRFSCQDYLKEDLINLLEKGKVLLLLDGLDEISKAANARIGNKIAVFLNTYKEITCILTSRQMWPLKNDPIVGLFKPYRLKDLTQEQAINLIRKIKLDPRLEASRERFINELKGRLFRTHKEFTSNPLLLSIMFMTHDQFGNVPKETYAFYDEAFLALSYRHDNLKDGFQRKLAMKITAEKFKDYFSEFCSRTFFDNKYELTEAECERYYNSLNYKKKDGLSATTRDFLIDATTNLCLMMFEGGKYFFIHRSFQEYFCALFLSKIKDKKLEKVGKMFEEKKIRMAGDKTLDMLYEMNPGCVEEYIIIPYLKNQFLQDDVTNYKLFLLNIYESYSFDYGDDGAPVFGNSTSSFLYDFISNKYGFNRWDENEAPSYIDNDFLVETFYRAVVIDENNFEEKKYVLLKSDETNYYYNKELYVEEPKEVGYVYEIDFKKVFDDVERYRDTIKAIYKDTFTLKMEFNDAKELLERLENKVSESFDDVFDID